MLDTLDLNLTLLVEGDCQRWARVKVLSQLVAVITQAIDRLKVPQPELPKLPPQVVLLPTEPDFLVKVSG